MAFVKSTSRGQVTLRKEVFQHLGIRPGDTFELDLLPGGELRGRAVKKTGKIEDVFGILKGKTNGVVLTIDEINEGIGQGIIDAYEEGLK